MADDTEGNGGSGLMGGLKKFSSIFVQMEPETTPDPAVADDEAPTPRRSRGRDPLGSDDPLQSHARPLAHVSTAPRTEASFEEIFLATGLSATELSQVKQVDESVADLSESDEATKRKFVTMALKNFVHVAPEAMVDICNRQIDAIDQYVQISTDETAAKVDALELEIRTSDEESAKKIADLQRQIESTKQEAAAKVASTRTAMEQEVANSKSLLQRSNAEKERIRQRIAIIGAPAPESKTK